jgi:hypothetical protein
MQRETIVEAMAVAIWEGNPDMTAPSNAISTAQAALTALEALGLAVVPREPTEAMIDAGDMHWNNQCGSCLLDIYRAMLAAAPLPAAPNQAEKNKETEND